MPLIRIDAARIHDWNSFHTVFAAAFGFPSFYGRTMNAWIDCMSDLGEDTGMTTVRASPTDPAVLLLDNVDAMPQQIFAALVEDAAFVNWRRLDLGEPAVFMLAFHRSSSSV